MDSSTFVVPALPSKRRQHPSPAYSPDAPEWHGIVKKRGIESHSFSPSDAWNEGSFASGSRFDGITLVEVTGTEPRVSGHGMVSKGSGSLHPLPVHPMITSNSTNPDNKGRNTRTSSSSIGKVPQAFIAGLSEDDVWSDVPLPPTVAFPTATLSRHSPTATIPFNTSAFQHEGVASTTPHDTRKHNPVPARKNAPLPVTHMWGTTGSEGKTSSAAASIRPAASAEEHKRSDAFGQDAYIATPGLWESRVHTWPHDTKHSTESVPSPPCTSAESKSDPSAIGARFTPKTKKSGPKVSLTGLKHLGGLGALQWSEEEDRLLRAAIDKYGDSDWGKIATLVPRRTAQQCLSRWTKALREGEGKGPWTDEEDQAIRDAVKEYGADSVKWAEVASRLSGRIGKQCRERWFNHLDPSIRRDPFTPEEDRFIFEMQQKIGHKWRDIASLLPGRTENAVKNRWNSAARRRWFVENSLALEERDRILHERSVTSNAKCSSSNLVVPFCAGMKYNADTETFYLESGGTAILSIQGMDVNKKQALIRSVEKSARPAGHKVEAECATAAPRIPVTTCIPKCYVADSTADSPETESELTNPSPRKPSSPNTSQVISTLTSTVFGMTLSSEASESMFPSVYVTDNGYIDNRSEPPSEDTSISRSNVDFGTSIRNFLDRTRSYSSSAPRDLSPIHDVDGGRQQSEPAGDVSAGVNEAPSAVSVATVHHSIDSVADAVLKLHAALIQQKDDPDPTIRIKALQLVARQAPALLSEQDKRVLLEWGNLVDEKGALAPPAPVPRDQGTERMLAECGALPAPPTMWFPPGGMAEHELEQDVTGMSSVSSYQTILEAEDWASSRAVPVMADEMPYAVWKPGADGTGYGEVSDETSWHQPMFQLADPLSPERSTGMVGRPPSAGLSRDEEFVRLDHAIQFEDLQDAEKEWSIPSLPVQANSGPMGDRGSASTPAPAGLITSNMTSTPQPGWMFSGFVFSSPPSGGSAHAIGSPSTYLHFAAELK